MSNGTSGDVNNNQLQLEDPQPGGCPSSRSASSRKASHKEWQRAYPGIKYVDDAVLAAKEAEVELGVRKPTADEVQAAEKLLAETPERPLKGTKLIYARETALLDAYPDTVRARLQAIRIGDLAIVSSPCETFTETGLAIKLQSPFRHTFTIELANGYNGYLPTPQQHEWGGYETWRARSSYLAVDAEPKIRERLLVLLREAKGE